MARLDELAHFSAEPRRADAPLSVDGAQIRGAANPDLDAASRDGGFLSTRWPTSSGATRDVSRATRADSRLAYRHGAQCRQVRRLLRRDRGDPGGGRAAPAGRAPALRDRSHRIRRRGGRALPGHADRLPNVAGNARSRRPGRGGRRPDQRPRGIAAVRLQPDGDSSRSRGARNKCSRYCELHIEQGPVLEAERLPVGIVTAINGASRFTIAVEGVAGHAGTVPMSLRRDALCAAAEMVLEIERLARDTDQLVATVGRIEALPGATNVIPSGVRFTLDIRSPSDELRAEAIGKLEEAFERIAGQRQVRLDMQRSYDEPAATCHPALIEQLEAAVSRAGDQASAAAQRRRSRRTGDGCPLPYRDAVCPLQGRHQSQSSRVDHDGGRRRGRAGIDRLPATLRAFEPAGKLSRQHQENTPPCLRSHPKFTVFWNPSIPDRSHFLAELVKTPSDNPPGDCAQHAEMAARLLEGLGLTVERHPVPEALVRKNGMITATNLVVRQRFGDGPGDRAERAWRRGAAGRRLDSTTPMAPKSLTAGCTDAAWRSRNRTSSPIPGRCSP